MNKKQKAYKYGLWAELLTIWYLRLCGYRLVEKRCRTPVGEIDIIAKYQDLIAIVEVKARRGGDNDEVLSTKQMKRISKASSYALAKMPEFVNYSVRFDLVIVRPWKLPKHIKDAWQANEI